MAVGDPVDSRTAPPPQLSKAEQAERGQRAKALSSQYRTELLDEGSGSWRNGAARAAIGKAVTSAPGPYQTFTARVDFDR